MNAIISSVLIESAEEINLTFLDVLELVRHYIKTAICIIIVCAIAGVSLGAVKAGLGAREYMAEAILTVSEPTATIAASELIPLVDAVAENVVASFDGDAVVEAASNVANRTISFTAVSGTEISSVEAANWAAGLTIEAAKEELNDLAESYRNLSLGTSPGDHATYDWGVLSTVDKDRAAAYESVSFILNDASQAASNSGLSTVLKYGLVGFVAGLLVAVCFLVVFDLLKSPIRNSRQLEDGLNLRVLAEGSLDSIGERLLGNIQFAGGPGLGTICLVPANCPVAEQVKSVLVKAIDDEGWPDSDGEVELRACPPLRSSMKSAYESRCSDATILCAVRWKDSTIDAANTMRELSLAQGNLIGVVLLDRAN